MTLEQVDLDLIKQRVIFGNWSGVAWRDDGHFQFKQEGAAWKVWRWDGRQMRRIKKWPADLLEGYTR